MNLKKIGLFIGPVLGLVLFVTLLQYDKGFAYSATAGIALWTALWFMFEPVPLAISGLIPLALFPILAILPTKIVSAKFGSNIAMLFIGGYMMALAIEKSRAHERIATKIIMKFGQKK